MTESRTTETRLSDLASSNVDNEVKWSLFPRSDTANASSTTTEDLKYENYDAKDDDDNTSNLSTASTKVDQVTQATRPTLKTEPQKEKSAPFWRGRSRPKRDSARPSWMDASLPDEERWKDWHKAKDRERMRYVTWRIRRLLVSSLEAPSQDSLFVLRQVLQDAVLT